MFETFARLWKPTKHLQETFLNDVSGLIHVGANIAQEREWYDRFDIDVLWVEPIPDIYDVLLKNLKGYSRQQAVKALVTDVDGKEYAFHIASNSGKSSSILDLKQHNDIWPNVVYTNTILLQSETLPSLLRRKALEPEKYQALVLDTQGSELMVLRGAEPILSNFKYVQLEVPDFESYAGCCQLADIVAFMASHGYVEKTRHEFARRPSGGRYYDIVYGKGKMNVDNGEYK